jgi:hypothetical protein
MRKCQALFLEGSMTEDTKDHHIPRESEQMTGLTPDKRWVRMLSEYFLEYNIRLPANPNILNVGCGNNVKWNYLAMAFYLADQSLGIPHYVAVDQKEEAFDDARVILDGVIRFIACDARKLTDFITETFHLVVFEHPNLTTSPKGPRIWQNVFQETAKLMDEKGVAIVTSFWLNDHLPAQAALERSHYDIVFSGKNKYPGKVFDTSANGESFQFDKYMIIAKRRH